MIVSVFMDSPMAIFTVIVSLSYLMEEGRSLINLKMERLMYRKRTVCISSIVVL